MNARTGLYTLVALNLALLSVSLAQQLRPALAQGELPVLRRAGAADADQR